MNLRSLLYSILFVLVAVAMGMMMLRDRLPEPARSLFERFAGPAPIQALKEGYVTSAMLLKLPTGEVRIEAGTRLEIVKETDEQVIANFEGSKVSLPRDAVSFEAPKPPATPTPAPLAKATPAPAKPLESQPAAPSVNRYSKSLLIIEGEQGSGSGSVIKVNGKPTIVTNIHVLDGNARLRFRQLDAREVPAQELSISRDYDLALIAQNQVQDALEMVENVDQEVRVNDAVVVLGNSEGSSVVTEIEGDVTGIGPALVEVSARFVEGNSGSPIIHVKTGKVIGIATFARVRKITTLTQDSQFTDVRRFGYRLDTAKDWEHPQWNRFLEEARAVEKVNKVTQELYDVAIDISKNGMGKIGIYTGPDSRTRSAVTDYLKVISKKSVAASDAMAARQRMLQNLMSISRLDLQGLNLNAFVSYHRRKLETEAENRTFLREKLTELITLQDATQRVRMQ